jgi:hypothetical protein
MRWLLQIAAEMLPPPLVGAGHQFIGMALEERACTRDC